MDAESLPIIILSGIAMLLVILLPVGPGLCEYYYEDISLSDLDDTLDDEEEEEDD